MAKTHRMPKVAGHVSPKGPFGAKEPLIIGLFCPKGAFRRKMTYEDKAPYASTPACIRLPGFSGENVPERTDFFPPQGSLGQYSWNMS